MPSTYKAKRLAIASATVHLESIEGLDADARHRLAILLYYMKPSTTRPEFYGSDAACRFNGIPSGLPPIDLKWFDVHAKEIGGVLPPGSSRKYNASLLDDAQRDDLFWRFNYARFMAKTLIDRCDSRPRDLEYCKAILRWTDAAERIKTRIAEYELPLALFTARQVWSITLTHEERISFAIEALLLAIDGFKPGKARFSSYAFKCIRSRVVGACMRDQRRKIDAIGQADSEQGPKDQPLLESLGHCDSDLPDIRLDLDGVLSEPGLLTDREQTILQRRFGLQIDNGLGHQIGQPESLEEVGTALGITRERVRQLQDRALEKLRSRFEGVPVPRTNKELAERRKARRQGRPIPTTNPDPDFVGRLDTRADRLSLAVA